MKQIKVGIIGFGLSGRIFHGAILGSHQGFEVCKIMTTDPEKAKQAQSDFEHVQVVGDVQPIFEDPTIELVVISTPNTTHYSLAADALKAGKHVVLEKPFTVTSTEASSLIALSKACGKCLSVYHNRRFDSDFRTVQQVLSEGELGRVVAFESRFERFRNELKQGSWREQDLPGSGILYDLGSHLLDQALTLFGMPQEIYADIRSERQGAVDDAFEMLLYYPGLKVTLLSSMLVKTAMPRFVIRGEGGSFSKFGLDVQEGDLRNGLRPVDDHWGKEPEALWGTLDTQEGKRIKKSLQGDYRLYYENIYQAIRLGIPLEVTAEAGLKVITLIELAIKSNQEKRRITV